MCSTWSGAAQTDRWMTSKYRESHLKSSLNALVVIWCHPPIGLCGATSSRTHLDSWRGVVQDVALMPKPSNWCHERRPIILEGRSYHIFLWIDLHGWIVHHKNNNRVPTGFGKVWNLIKVLSRSGKIWKQRKQSMKQYLRFQTFAPI